MASVSKILTAVAIMQLVEQGKIDSEARVTKYLPDFTMQGTNYVGMTVHLLLNHTSGLKDDFGHDYVPTEDPMGQAVTDLADQISLLSRPRVDLFGRGICRVGRHHRHSLRHGLREIVRRPISWNPWA